LLDIDEFTIYSFRGMMFGNFVFNVNKVQYSNK